MSLQQKIKRILISRTDSIGDVALTLPMCVWIKQHFPNAQIVYLGRAYTKPIISKFAVVDSFEDWASIENLTQHEQIQYFKNLAIDAIIHVFPNKKIANLGKKAQIPLRIGSSHRIYHWLTCNVRVNFSRKRSDLHESQLNFHLLKPLGLLQIPSNQEIDNLCRQQLMESKAKLPNAIEKILSERKTVILHPKSQGSALEWPIENYFQLSINLANAGFNVLFSGTDNEGVLFRNDIPQHDHIIDLTGKLTLDEFMVCIQKSNTLVACSTGPLHIAGLYGIQTIGLYSPRIPIHPGRWKPLGSQVTVIVFNEDCPDCKAGKNCSCIAHIPVSKVEQLIQ
jgi:ADP-heptose:LPS heptosyltransferase